MRSLLASLTWMLGSCISTLHVSVESNPGKHQLPFRPNERFILESVVEGPGLWMNSPISLIYHLDGRRRQWTLGGEGSTDGFVTDMGRLCASETEGVDSPIMDERVIRLATGEEITVIGNTTEKGWVRLRKKQ